MRLRWESASAPSSLSLGPTISGSRLRRESGLAVLRNLAGRSDVLALVIAFSKSSRVRLKPEGGSPKEDSEMEVAPVASLAVVFCNDDEVDSVSWVVGAGLGESFVASGSFQLFLAILDIKL